MAGKTPDNTGNPAPQRLGGWLSRLLARRPGRLAAFGAAALSLGGCTPLGEYVHNGFKVGPNYKRPPAPVAADWIDAGDVRVRKECDDLSKWWTVFNDPVLDALVNDATART